MSKMNFKNKNDLKEVYQLVEIADKSINNKNVVLTKGSKAAKIVGKVLGGAAGAGLIGAGVIGATGVTTSAAFLTAAGTAATVSLWIAAAPAVIAVTAIGGVGFLATKNKRMQKLYEEKLSTYTKTVEKQNAVYEKIIEMNEENKKDSQNTQEDIQKFKEKLAEYMFINEALVKQIKKLKEDIEIAQNTGLQTI